MSGIDKFIKVDDVTRFIIGERRSGDDRRTSKEKPHQKEVDREKLLGEKSSWMDSSL